MHKLTNLDEVITKLRAFLPQYLMEHDIDTSKNFACLNPKHEDKTPSMSCKQNPENAFCFSCMVTCDIFQAAHYLEDKPISGPEFIEKNVKYLAEKYGIDLQLEEMTEDELYRYRTYRAYKDAADLIVNRQFGDYSKLDVEIEKRGWNPETIKVGTVIYKDFRNALKNMGYEPRFQDEIDLGRPDIFNEENMIFTICDEFGRPVGFAARNLAYDGEHGAKYLNQKTTGLRCNIYQKGRRLYELHTALKYTPPIFIFEGYTDVLTAQNAGFFNCCAIGGTAFTQQHLELLKQLNQFHVIMCLDGDKPGQTRTAELLDKFFSSCQRDMEIEIVNLPDGLDPDDIIRQKGLETFLALKKWSAFEWRLNQYSDDADPETVCKIMIPLIVNEQSHVRQDKLCGILSQFTGIDKQIIASELNRLQSEKERHKHREKEAVLEQIWSEIRRTPEDTKVLLYECASRIEAIENKYDENTFSIESTLQFVDAERALQDAMTGEFAGFNLSEMGLQGLGEYLNGNWRDSVFFCFGGSANSGKCIQKDQRIQLLTGEYKTIENVVRDKDTNIITMDSQHKLRPGKITNWIDSGQLDCFRVTTDDGLEIIVSETHPFYTLAGWKQVKDLHAGEHIACCNDYRGIWDTEHGKGSELELAKARLLGALLSDGSITKCIGLSNIDDEILQQFQHDANLLFPELHFRRDKNNTTFVSYQKGKQNPIAEWLRELGIMGCNSHEKFIPSYIFTLPPRSIAAFLGMFYACDGWVSGSEIGLTLCNRQMLLQVRSLLLRFGIRTKIIEGTGTCNGQVFQRFSIAIRDVFNQIKFYNNIRIPLGRKHKALQKHIKTIEKPRGGYSDAMPASLWYPIKVLAHSQGLSMSTLGKLITPTQTIIQYDPDGDRFREHSGCKFRYDQGISRNMLQSIGYILQNQQLISLANGDIYFDKIVNVVPAGKHQCYDVEIENTHNFVANDIIVHNTSLLSQFGYEIGSNQENNATVIYHSIDDSKEQILPRLICQAYGNPDLTMNQVRNPNYYLKYDPAGKEIAQRRALGYQELRRLMRDGRIVLKDVSDGSSFAFGEGLIRYYKGLYPDRNIVYILDNLHKSPDFSNMEPRMRFKTLSNHMKETSVRHHCTIMATVEYTKLEPGVIPHNNNIAETRAVIYDASFIGHLFNDLHENGPSAVCTHKHQDEVLPRLRLGIGKNKVTEFKGRIFLDFFPASGIFRRVATEVAEHDMKACMAARKEEKQRASETGTYKQRDSREDDE